jgi:hypothetical protein
VGVSWSVSTESELAHRERLGHVVVGAGVERAYLVARAGPAGQDDDRRPVPAAQLDDDLGAGTVREAEDDRVRRPAGGQRQRLPSGARGDDVVQPGPQAELQYLPQFRVVLGDQDPGHAIPMARSLPVPR